MRERRSSTLRVDPWFKASVAHDLKNIRRVRIHGHGLDVGSLTLTPKETKAKRNGMALSLLTADHADVSHEESSSGTPRVTTWIPFDCRSRASDRTALKFLRLRFVQNFFISVHQRDQRLRFPFCADRSRFASSRFFGQKTHSRHSAHTDNYFMTESWRARSVLALIRSEDYEKLISTLATAGSSGELLAQRLHATR